MAEYLRYKICFNLKNLRIKKTVLALIFVLGLAPYVNAQNRKSKEIRSSSVPTAVLNTFKSTFANARDVEWKKKDNNYKVSFEMRGIDHHATLNSSGKIISQGHEIAPRDIPGGISGAIKNSYPNHRIDDVFVM